MSTIYLLNYNNYYNRTLRKESTLADYLSKDADYRQFTNINFVKADGISTKLTLNYVPTPPATTVADKDGDYLIVCDENNTIKSRWFVIEAEWNRQHQQLLTLRRDVLVDYYDDYKDSPFYCEKGCVSSVSDYLIYNTEDFTTNQILRNKVKIVNHGESTNGYIVAYIPNDKNAYTIKQYKSRPTLTDERVTLNIPSNRITPTNCPYCILWFSATETGYKLANILSDNLAGSGALYDIQLSPYPPQYTSANNLTAQVWHDITLGNEGHDDITVHQGDSSELNFEFTVSSANVGIDYYTATTDKIVGKWYNQSLSCRLCGIGNSSTYEFNPFRARNENNIKLDVYVVFRPIQLYIYIRPQYAEGGLYRTSTGSITLDARGLDVSGDFSLPITTDAWMTYQIQNKNYMNTFNRETESLELTNRYALYGDIAGSVSGAVSGATTGAILGGGLIGGVVGGVGGAVTGVADIFMNEKLRNESMDLRQDQFNMQLGNIKALPNQLSRGSAVCKTYPDIFPTIELYVASTVEENAFKDKIKWNGMKLGITSTFATMFGRLATDCRYVKGKLIRAKDIKDDFHIVKEINNELYKGVYKYYAS